MSRTDLDFDPARLAPYLRERLPEFDGPTERTTMRPTAPAAMGDADGSSTWFHADGVGVIVTVGPRSPATSTATVTVSCDAEGPKNAPR